MRCNVVHPGVLVCGNWGILESDDAALVHRVWWGEGAMSALGLTACALLCDPWCGVLVSWWVVSGLLCGPTACTLAVRCFQLDDTCDPNVCDAWCLGSSYPGVHFFF